MLADPDRSTVEQAYARWAPVHDALCGPVFLDARRAATTAAKQAGLRILEIDVGTGLSFADDDPRCDITGIDLSEPMIARARMRASGGRYPQVKASRVMDAEVLDFPDAAFDCVVARFVITLVANPERVLDECARVVRPGGEIILVNHYQSETGFARKPEDGLARCARPLGLNPAFPFARLAAWADAHGGTEVIERRKIPPFKVFTLVRFRRKAA